MEETNFFSLNFQEVKQSLLESFINCQEEKISGNKTNLNKFSKILPIKNSKFSDEDYYLNNINHSLFLKKKEIKIDNLPIENDFDEFQKNIEYKKNINKLNIPSTNKIFISNVGYLDKNELNFDNFELFKKKERPTDIAENDTNRIKLNQEKRFYDIYNYNNSNSEFDYSNCFNKNNFNLIKNIDQNASFSGNKKIVSIEENIDQMLINSNKTENIFNKKTQTFDVENNKKLLNVSKNFKLDDSFDIKFKDIMNIEKGMNVNELKNQLGITKTKIKKLEYKIKFLNQDCEFDEYLKIKLKYLELKLNKNLQNENKLNYLLKELEIKEKAKIYVDINCDNKKNFQKSEVFNNVLKKDEKKVTYNCYFNSQNKSKITKEPEISKKVILGKLSNSDKDLNLLSNKFKHKINLDRLNLFINKKFQEQQKEIVDDFNKNLSETRKGKYEKYEIFAKVFENSKNNPNKNFDFNKDEATKETHNNLKQVKIVCNNINNNFNISNPTYNYFNQAKNENTNKNTNKLLSSSSGESLDDIDEDVSLRSYLSDSDIRKEASDNFSIEMDKKTSEDDINFENESLNKKNKYYNISKPNQCHKNINCKKKFSVDNNPEYMNFDTNKYYASKTRNVHNTDDASNKPFEIMYGHESISKFNKLYFEEKDRFSSQLIDFEKLPRIHIDGYDIYEGIFYQICGINSKKRKKFFCKFSHCQKVLVSKSSFILHFKFIHMKIKNFICSICKKFYSRKTTLKRHMHQVHQVISPFPCPYSDCYLSYENENNLNNHIKKAHSKITPFVKIRLGVKRNIQRNFNYDPDNKFNEIDMFSGKIEQNQEKTELEKIVMDMIDKDFPE